MYTLGASHEAHSNVRFRGPTNAADSSLAPEHAGVRVKVRVNVGIRLASFFLCLYTTLRLRDNTPNLVSLATRASWLISHGLQGPRILTQTARRTSNWDATDEMARRLYPITALSGAPRGYDHATLFKFKEVALASARRCTRYAICHVGFCRFNWLKQLDRVQLDRVLCGR